ncbi:MAG: class I SAM-dependent methyltransferase [Microbacteriaceae bacterium]
MDERVEVNRRRWEEMTDLHVVTYRIDERDQLADYSLKSFEFGELGPIDGARICHLQCHTGDNSFALAQRGAAEVVGVDFSRRSIEVASARAARVGLADRVRFVEATVEDAVGAAGSGFDGVYTSWGVLCWLPDIRAWAATVHDLLGPGGWLYLADTHPYAAALHWPGYPYGGTTAVFDDGQGDYTDADAVFEHPESWEWNHGIGEIVTALAEAGLTLDWLHEHPAAGWHLNDRLGLVERDDGMWEAPGSTLPLSFSLHATKLDPSGT